MSCWHCWGLCGHSTEALDLCGCGDLPSGPLIRAGNEASNGNTPVSVFHKKCIFVILLFHHGKKKDRKSLGVILNLIPCFQLIFSASLLYCRCELQFHLLRAELCIPAAFPLTWRVEADQSPSGDDSGQMPPSGGVSASLHALQREPRESG